MSKKIEEAKYQQLYNYLNQILNNIHYNRKITLYEQNSKYLGGAALSKTKIALTNSVLQKYSQTHPVTKSLLSHELAHVISGDTPLQGIKDFVKDKHTRRLINIIKEIRAEIIGSSIGQLTSDEINKAQNEIMKINDNTKVYYEAYTGSNGKYKAYPTRIQIKYFSKRYNSLTNEVIDYFINSYFKHVGVTDQKERSSIENKVYNRFK